MSINASSAYMQTRSMYNLCMAEHFMLIKIGLKTTVNFIIVCLLVLEVDGLEDT